MCDSKKLHKFNMFSSIIKIVGYYRATLDRLYPFFQCSTIITILSGFPPITTLYHTLNALDSLTAFKP